MPTLTATPGPSAGRKADVVADDLLRRIVAGEVAVGSVLPKEQELAERYRVNRSVVREAIKLLEVHRLVRPVRRRGTVVLDPVASLSPEVLRAMLRPRPGAIDRPTLAGLLEIRAGLDVQMSALAAERRTERDLAAMDACLSELRAALGDRARYDGKSDELARLVARATQNRVFEMLVSWNQVVVRDLAEVFRVVRPANEPHWEGMALLVELIRQRDVEQTRALVTTFHQWSTPRLLAAATLSAGAPLERALEEIR